MMTLSLSPKIFLYQLVMAMALLTMVWLGACAEQQQDGLQTPSLDLGLPDSLTGGTTPVNARVALTGAPKQGAGGPCFYQGVEDGDLFKNGYNMTKFMVSAVAVWTCVADLLIDVSDYVEHDGVIHETDNDTAAPDYDPEDPTHYSVTDDSETQVTIRMYYGFDRINPPGEGDYPQFFASWIDNGDNNIDGRLIFEVSGIEANPARDPEDPIAMRMDFTYSETQKLADMYLRFDANNEWAEGFRIEVSKDLEVNPLTQVFLARGLMDMKRQFVSAPGIDEIPAIKMYTVANGAGKGAAIAEFDDLGVEFPLGPFFGDQNLGSYLFTKTDRYFFEADGDWEYIFKDITGTEYKGNNNTTALTNSAIENEDALDLPSGTIDACVVSEDSGVNDDCKALLNAIFVDGFAGQEPNQGSDPGDWRSNAMANPDYLKTVYPNGSNWEGAFEQVFP